MSQANIETSEFRAASGFWTTGVSIVSTADLSGIPFGLTMNSVTSLSLEPPMYLVCVDLSSDTMEPMLERNAFCINILTDFQKELSNRFAKKGDNKFESVSWKTAATKTPIISDSFLSIECDIQHVYSGGDHKIVCGNAIALHFNDDPDVKPLIYYKGKYASLSG